MKAGDLLELQYPTGLAPGELDLLPLAEIAVLTPLIAAEPTLNVLADLLLERGIIKEHDHQDIESLEAGRWASTFAAPPTPLESALAWARAKTSPSIFEKLRAFVQSKSIDFERGTVTVGRQESMTSGVAIRSLYEPMAMAPFDWSDTPRRQRRGINGAPLALRAKLKPWER